MLKSYTNKYFMSRLKKLRVTISRIQGFKRIEHLLGEEVNAPDLAHIALKRERTK